MASRDNTLDGNERCIGHLSRRSRCQLEQASISMRWRAPAMHCTYECAIWYCVCSLRLSACRDTIHLLFYLDLCFLIPDNIVHFHATTLYCYACRQSTLTGVGIRKFCSLETGIPGGPGLELVNDS